MAYNESDQHQQTRLLVTCLLFLLLHPQSYILLSSHNVHDHHPQTSLPLLTTRRVWDPGVCVGVSDIIVPKQENDVSVAAVTNIDAQNHNTPTSYNPCVSVKLPPLPSTIAPCGTAVSLISVLTQIPGHMCVCR